MDDLLHCAGGGFVLPDGTMVALENVAATHRAICGLFPRDPDAAVKSLCDCALEIHEAGLPGLVADYVGRALEAGGTAEATARALLELGAALERAEDLQAAAACYDSAMHLPERSRFDWYFLHNNLGYCNAVLGRFAEAVPHCLTAIRIDPGRHNAFKNLGLAFRGLGRVGEAAGCFRHAYAVEPEDDRARQLLADLIFGGRVDAVPDLWLRCRDLKLAVSGVLEMERGGATVAGRPVALNDSNGMYLAFVEYFGERTGPICIALGMLVWLHALKGIPVDLERALDRIAGVGTRPEGAHCLVKLADNLGRIGEREMALATFERAESLIPPEDHFLQVGHHCNFGRFLIDIGRHREAEPRLREALRLDPWHARSHRGLGIALLARGRKRAAETAILTADLLCKKTPRRIAGTIRARATP